MSHLVPLFQINNITGLILENMSVRDMFQLEILKPTDIYNLIKLQKKWGDIYFEPGSIDLE